VSVYTPANRADQGKNCKDSQYWPDFLQTAHGGSDEPGAEGEEKGAFQELG